jgi:hypothetical protein
MSKKLYWIIGLALIITLGAIIYWKFEWPRGQKIWAGKVAEDKCVKAQYPFACFLDRAMSASDPNLCAAAQDKRVNCLKAYAEIQETEIDCTKIQEMDFRQECQTAFKP